MRRKHLLMIVLAIVIVGVAISALLAQGEQLVTLCHRPPGNPENAQTLTVASAAAPAHFGHGDTAGPCPVSPGQ